jgi:tetrahydromethanopterin S-methyltransferase subunit C
MRSAQRSLCATMLALQAVVLGLTTPVLISVSDVPVGTALLIGLGLMVACIVGAGMLRHRWAYGLGWAIQVASLALGLVISMMFLLGVVFTSLWAGAYFLGAKVDRERAEREVLEQQWAAEHGQDG